MTEHRGGSGNFAEDKEKASEAGKKAARTAAAILKTIVKKPQKPVRKGARTAIVAPDTGL